MKGGRWGYALKLWDYASAPFGERHTQAHALSGGPLGPNEMSVCGLIQPPVPVLMMASTCCFNVTAGSPSIPHWLWLPSAAGSSPLYPPPSISSAISLHFHLIFLINIPSIHLCVTFFLLPSCSTKSCIALPLLPFFCPSFLFSATLSLVLFFLMAYYYPVLLLLQGKWPKTQQDLWVIGS